MSSQSGRGPRVLRVLYVVVSESWDPGYPLLGISESFKRTCGKRGSEREKFDVTMSGVRRVLSDSLLGAQTGSEVQWEEQRSTILR